MCSQAHMWGISISRDFIDMLNKHEYEYFVSRWACEHIRRPPRAMMARVFVFLEFYIRIARVKEPNNYRRQKRKRAYE